MITDDKEMIKIIDFGVSRLISTDMNQATTFCGTPLYMSPEVVKNEKYSFPTDVWSVGIILYEFITLQFPFDNTSMLTLINSIVNGSIPLIKRNCDSKLKNAVISMLQLDPNKRITFSQLEKELSVISSSNGLPEQHFKLGMNYLNGKDRKEIPKKLKKHFNRQLNLVMLKQCLTMGLS
jgi:NIMA (never in mitosis gene a)-related kinase